MNHIIKFNLFESSDQVTYQIEWKLEDVSGDCSPSGSTTVDSGVVEFDNIEDKDSIIDDIVEDNSRATKCKLYGTFKTLNMNGEIISEEDIDFSGDTSNPY